jgi:hypothetical protein
MYLEGVGNPCGTVRPPLQISGEMEIKTVEQLRNSRCHVSGSYVRYMDMIYSMHNRGFNHAHAESRAMCSWTRGGLGGAVVVGR